MIGFFRLHQILVQLMWVELKIVDNADMERHENQIAQPVLFHATLANAIQLFYMRFPFPGFDVLSFFLLRCIYKNDPFLAKVELCHQHGVLS